MNPRLNISEIVGCFPKQVAGLHGKPVYNLMSPHEVAIRENQLGVVRSQHDLGPEIPAHYFVYALGEAPTREQSRIGGLPYRPRKLKWPHDTSGKPKEFVCQIDFSDSRTMLPTLPGDILLVFASEDGLDDPPFTLEWYPIGLVDLICNADLPGHDFMFPIVREKAHCYLYETHDYPEASKRLQGTKYETWKTIGVPCGSKIAGHQETLKGGACHIFTFESVRLSTNDPYPFINLKGWKAPSFRAQVGAWLNQLARRFSGLRPRPNIFDVLMIGDLGRISVFHVGDDRFEVDCLSH
jgi:hypothetical protein